MVVTKLCPRRSQDAILEEEATLHLVVTAWVRNELNQTQTSKQQPIRKIWRRECFPLVRTVLSCSGYCEMYMHHAQFSWLGQVIFVTKNTWTCFNIVHFHIQHFTCTQLGIGTVPWTNVETWVRAQHVYPYHDNRSLTQISWLAEPVQVTSHWDSR